MNLEEALSNPPMPEPVRRDKPNIPKAGDPGTWEWDGSRGVINTQPTLERVTNWDAYLIDAGLDPEAVEVVEPVNVRGYDANVGDGNIVKMHYYSLKVQTRRGGPNIDDLLSLVKRSRKKKFTDKVENGATFVVALGDLQLGKIDGDGAAGTLERICSGIEESAASLKRARKTSKISTVHLAFLGDCIEGFVSQGGNNAWRTNLTLTEQIKLLRRIMFFAVETLSPYTDTMTAIAVPGNHDQSVRFGSKGITKYDDSFDVDALSAVSDACKMKPESFDHVSFHVPAKDEMTVTLETSGTIIGAAHGHQMQRGKHFNWWSGQSFGDFPVGQADILLTGHFHHFMVEQSGKRTFIQVPALEAESTWYRHMTGVTGNPGVLTFITKDKKINSLEVV